jgi:hypothetical protein
LIIPMIIQTIGLYPSGAVWTDEASNVSRLDPSGADQADAEHPSRNRKVEASTPDRPTLPLDCPKIDTRIVAPIEQRLAVSFAGCCPSAARPAALERHRPGGSDPPGR